MKKRGFTLVELLAVIVVIGLILVIVVPRVLKNIDEEKKSTFMSSAKALIRKVEYDYMDKEDFDYVALKTFNINDISMSNYDIDNSTIKKKNGNIYIKLIGKEEFEGYKCIGTINNLNCREKKACTTLKALTQGTTYVNGQYTYTYNGSTGWSVVLTDKESTDPVTTELCETVNDKPIVSMYQMFYNSKAESIDTSSFDTSKVTNMNYMFSGSQATSLDVSNFDTAKVANMEGMFAESKVKSLDLSSFDTSNVTNMHYMFAHSKITSLDLSSFDTSNVTNMDYMFVNTFNNIGAVTCYVRTQADADRFNVSSGKPSWLTFVVKSS